MKTARLRSPAAVALALVLAGSTQAIAAVVLEYCGYIGGSGNEFTGGIAVDADGNGYVAGYTSSTELTFPAAVGPDPTYNGGADDTFVVKVRADGTRLTYAGYIGGSSGDAGGGIAVDATGNAYTTGSTESKEATFPVAVGPDLTFNGGSSDAFVAKVLSDGTGLAWAGYIGGDAQDIGTSIALDALGSAYVAGWTESSETTFPAAVGPDLTFNQPFQSGYDAFVAKLRGDGTGLVYAGYIGGWSGPEEFGRAVAVDGAGSAYVVGSTRAAETSFPVRIGPDLTYKGGPHDAFVAKVLADGTDLAYAGYIGGDGNDGAGGIAVDVPGNAFVAGGTGSTEATFPVTVGPDLTIGGPGDGFVAKVLADGTGLAWAGYIGGDGDDGAGGIALDAAGNVIVAGGTTSTEASFPVAAGPDLSQNGGSDGFVAKILADGTAVAWAGYIGGSEDDGAGSIAVDPVGRVSVAGSSASGESTFPVTVGPDLTYNGGGWDAFVARIAETACVALPQEIRELRAVRAPGAIDDVAMTWQPDSGARGYNLWYVLAKADIPYADQKDQPPAIGVAGCASPAPTSGPACTDAGAVLRGSPSVFFYQVRAFCDPANEGP